MILAIGEILFDMFPEGRRLGGAPFNFAFHIHCLDGSLRFLSRNNHLSVRAATAVTLDRLLGDFR